jgi:predicted RNase H-like HicB family nuclease
MDHRFPVVVRRDAEGRYFASVAALPGCQTRATSLDQLIDRIKDAIALYLRVEGEDADSKPISVGIL